MSFSGLALWIWDFRCYSRGLRNRAQKSGGGTRFGFCPKISTPVENTVEKRALQGWLAQKT
jgi:hypothetical protein